MSSGALAPSGKHGPAPQHATKLHGERERPPGGGGGGASAGRPSASGRARRGRGGTEHERAAGPRRAAAQAAPRGAPKRAARGAVVVGQPRYTTSAKRAGRRRSAGPPLARQRAKGGARGGPPCARCYGARASAKPRGAVASVQLREARRSWRGEHGERVGLTANTRQTDACSTGEIVSARSALRGRAILLPE